MVQLDEITAVLALGHRTEVESFRALRGAERVACGSPECWAAKDLLAHNTFWRRYTAENLRLVARGQPPAVAADYEPLNQRCFAEHRGWSCEDLLALSEDVQRWFMASVSPLDDPALASETRWPGEAGRPAWQFLVHIGFMHPVSHFCQYHAAQGRGNEALNLWQRAAPAIAGLDEGPRWRGLMTYCRACKLALGGRMADALDALREGLELRPDLRQRASRDGDLRVLRGSPEFESLVSVS
jgi:hypothetical protein